MSNLMKTRVVSDKLGVHPTTIQRWIKFFDVDWRKNEHGHYLFTDEDILFFQQIKHQLDNGLALNEITIPLKRNGIEQEGKFEEKTKKIDLHIEQRLEVLEAAISQKADDVVSYQVLQQRKEIEELIDLLSSLEERIEAIEAKLTTTNSNKVQAAYEPQLEMLSRPVKQAWLRRVFSLFI